MSATGQEGAAGSQAPRPSTPERLPRRQQFLEWKRQRERLQQQQQQNQQLGRRHSSTPADLERQRLLLHRRMNMTPLTLKAAGVGPQESPSPASKRRNSSSSGLKAPSPTTSKEKQRAFLPLASDEHHDDTTTGSEPTHSGTNSAASADGDEDMTREEEEPGDEKERRKLEFLLQEELGEVLGNDSGAANDDKDDVESHGDSSIEEDVAILDEPMPLMEFDPERATPVDVKAEEEGFVYNDEESFDTEQEEDPAFWQVSEEAERLLMNYSMQSETTEEDAHMDFSLSASSDAFREKDQHFRDDCSHELHLTEYESSDIDHQSHENDSLNEQEELDYEPSEIELKASGVDETTEELNDRDQDEHEELAVEPETALSDVEGPKVDTFDDLGVELPSTERTVSGTMILAFVYTTVLICCAVVCQYYPDSSLGQWLLSTLEQVVLFCEDSYASILKNAAMLWNTTLEHVGFSMSALEDLLIGSYAVWHHAIHMYVPKIDLKNIIESVSITLAATIDRAHPLLEDPVGHIRGAVVKVYDFVESGVAFISSSLSNFWLNSVSTPNISSEDLIDASRKRLLEPLQLNKGFPRANGIVREEELWALNEMKRKSARRSEISQAMESVVAHAEFTIMKEIEGAKRSASDQIKARAQHVVDEIDKALQMDEDQFDQVRVAAEAKRKIDLLAQLEINLHQEKEYAGVEALAAKRDLEQEQQLAFEAEAEAELARMVQLEAENLITQSESDLVEVEIEVDVEFKNEQIHSSVEIKELEVHLGDVGKPSYVDSLHLEVDNSALPSIEETPKSLSTGMDVHSVFIMSVISLVFLAFGGIAAYFLRLRIQRMMRRGHSRIKRKRWQRPVELSDSEEEVVVLLSDDNADEEPEPEKVSPIPDRRRVTSTEVFTTSNDEAVTTFEVPQINAVSIASEQEHYETRTSESSVSSAGQTMETISTQDTASPSPSSVRRSRRLQRRHSSTRNQ